MGAFELFEQIRAAGWTGLEAWKADREPETFELEFKGKGNAAPKLNDFDRANIARATSGFANVSGGVLVIGIDTAKQDGADRVDELRPTKSLTAYVDAINRHLAVCSDPRVPGARAIGIECAKDEGLVALYVPASDGGPHRAKGGSDGVNDLYFARQGTQTIVLAHSLLGAMFGRVPPPLLDVEVEQRDDPNGDFNFTVAVRNTGRALARNVLLRIELIAEHSGGQPSIVRHRSPLQEFHGWTRVLRQSKGSPNSWFFAFESFVYPDDDLSAVVCLFPPAPRFSVLRYRGRIDAEGMAPVIFDRTHPLRG